MFFLRGNILKDTIKTNSLSVTVRVLLGLLLAAVLAGVDQLTKWLVVSNMELHESIHLIMIGDTQVLNFSYYLNDGSAFSMFEGQTTMLVAVTCLMMGGMVIAMLLKKVQRTSYILAFSLVIGGGVGNLIDRLFNDGNVIDFIDVRIINFAIFNFADICAVCGGLLLCALVIADEIREKRDAKKAKEAKEAPAADDNDEDAALSDEMTVALDEQNDGND